MRLRLLFTNIPDPEEKVGVVELYYGRCGEGEGIHSILKRDFAGGMMPSGKFGSNACWWRLAAVTHNVMMLLRVCALGAAWLRVRMKRVRARLLHLPGRGPPGMASDRSPYSRSSRIWGRFAGLTEPYEIQENWRFGSNKSNIGVRFLDYGTFGCDGNHPI